MNVTEAQAKVRLSLLLFGTIPRSFTRSFPCKPPLTYGCYEDLAPITIRVSNVKRFHNGIKVDCMVDFRLANSRKPLISSMNGKVIMAQLL